MVNTLPPCTPRPRSPRGGGHPGLGLGRGVPRPWRGRRQRRPGARCPTPRGVPGAPCPVPGEGPRYPAPRHGAWCPIRGEGTYGPGKGPGARGLVPKEGPFTSASWGWSPGHDALSPRKVPTTQHPGEGLRDTMPGSPQGARSIAPCPRGWSPVSCGPGEGPRDAMPDNLQCALGPRDDSRRPASREGLAALGPRDASRCTLGLRNASQRPASQRCFPAPCIPGRSWCPASQGCFPLLCVPGMLPSALRPRDASQRPVSREGPGALHPGDASRCSVS